MTYLYLTESNIKLGYSEGQVVVKKLVDGTEQRIPFSNVEGISVFGMAQLSTQLIRECLAADVTISYYSDDGHYFGNIGSFSRIDPERQKRQILLTDDKNFCLSWARRIIVAKIQNSITVLNSMKDIYAFADNDYQGLKHSLANLAYADTVDMVLGFEGNAAKTYFRCLSKALVNENFAFNGRSARPPCDPFNSMISFGYSLFYRNIVGAIERHGLHPYFAYMHRTKFGHASLASDLIEEYRAPLIDKTVVDFVNSGEIAIDEFYENEAGAVYMKTAAAKRLADRFSEIITEKRFYFSACGNRKSYGFQAMLDVKLNMLVEAIDKKNPDCYIPFILESEEQ